MEHPDYIKKTPELLQPDIVSMLTEIHEHRVEQQIYIAADGDLFSPLLETARTNSIEIFKRFSGMSVTEERFKLIVLNKTIPANQNEQEIAGYRDALVRINANYEFLPLNLNTVLDIHRELFKYSSSSGGSCKNAEFTKALETLCGAYNEALRQQYAEPLLLIPLLCADLLRLSPFPVGNARVSQLLTLLLLYRSGYIIGKYNAIEHSTDVRQFLAALNKAYAEFSHTAKVITAKSISKPERIRKLIKRTDGTITKSEIMAQCPDISQITVQRTLADLLAKGEILKISGGRYTSYIWNREK